MASSTITVGGVEVPVHRANTIIVGAGAAGAFGLTELDHRWPS